MPKNTNNDNEVGGGTRSGRTYSIGDETSNSGDITEKNKIIINVPGDLSDVMETRDEEISEYGSGRDPVVSNLLELVNDLKRDIREMRKEIREKKAVSPTRSKQTISYRNVDIPVNLNTDSSIDDDSEHGDSESQNNSRRIRKGSGIGNGGFTLRIPKGGWIKDPFEEIKFYGENDRQNPVIFLRSFENVAKYEEIPEGQQLYDFRRAMKGPAKHWIEAIDPRTIETAKTLFLEMYWGRAAQKIFKKHLHNGKY